MARHGPWGPTPGTSDAWRAWYHRYSTRVYGPGRRTTWLSWIADERVAIGSVPTGDVLPRLPVVGVTHVVNCRAALQTWISQDLSLERALLGPSRVIHAPMWDSGRHQPPRRWAAAAQFSAQALDEDPDARVLVHCHRGRRRSVLVAYAVLRLRGRSAEEAAHLILSHRAEAQLVPAYVASVEDWLAAGGAVASSAW
jgi:protein-tyrosine phosphatase